jgi:AraC family transcriptional regulator
MPGDLHWRSCYESPMITIGEYRCRPSFSGRGGEETTPWHSIVFVRSGLFVKHIRGKEVVADANQVLFFNGSEPYRVSHPVAGGDVCTSFALEWNTLMDVLSDQDPAAQDRPETPFRFTHGPSEPGYFQRYQQIFHAVERAGVETLAVEESALSLLAAVVRSVHRLNLGQRTPARPATARFQRERVEAAKLFIGAHFRERLGLSQVARAVHLSPYHLCRLFKRETGAAVHQYQNRLRLRAALDSLSDPRQDLTRLALDVGYFDLSHLSNAFRQEFGISPSEFRRRRMHFSTVRRSTAH